MYRTERKVLRTWVERKERGIDKKRAKGEGDRRETQEGQALMQWDTYFILALQLMGVKYCKYFRFSNAIVTLK